MRGGGWAGLWGLTLTLVACGAPAGSSPAQGAQQVLSMPLVPAPEGAPTTSPRAASGRICTPGARASGSPWPGWSAIAALGPAAMFGVDGAGAIYLAEWDGGYMVRKGEGDGWRTLGRSRVAAMQSWAFAVTPGGTPVLARTVWEGPASDAPPAVKVEVLPEGTWAALGEPLPVDPWWFPWRTPGKPALAAGDGGDLLLMLDSNGQRVYRWRPGAPGWTALGPETFRLASGYGELESAVAPAGEGGAVALSTWTVRVDANLGCYDDGAQAARLDGSSWTELGELKQDRRTNPDSGCPYASLRHAALAVDAAGVAWAAFVEGPLPATTATLHLVRWNGASWEEERAWPGVALAPRVSLGATAGGALWVVWTEPDGDGARVVIAHRADGAWSTVDALPVADPAAEGAIVCADEQGNPVLAVTTGGGGLLLRRR